MEQQTWWNDNAHKMFDTFKDWVGDKNAPSKLYTSLHFKNKHYTSILDLGCGNCTLFGTLKDTNVNYKYTGVDSCIFFNDINTNRGIHMINSDVRKVDSVENSSYDFAFSRHVLEHQPEPNSTLAELIRIAKKEACHIFFIKPTSSSRHDIRYDAPSNLYHNIYSKLLIEEYLASNNKVVSWRWVDITDDECALHIITQTPYAAQCASPPAPASTA